MSPYLIQLFQQGQEQASLRTANGLTVVLAKASQVRPGSRGIVERALRKEVDHGQGPESPLAADGRHAGHLQELPIEVCGLLQSPRFEVGCGLLQQVGIWGVRCGLTMRFRLCGRSGGNHRFRGHTIHPRASRRNQEECGSQQKDSPEIRAPHDITSAPAISVLPAT